MLASIASLREALEVHRRGIRETLGFAAAALATLAASFALVAASFEWGHIASSFLAAAIGGGLLGLSGFLRSKGLALASYVWLGVVLVEAVGFDADHFYSDATTRSVGGLSVIAAAIGIHGGAYTHRMAERDWRAGGVLAGVAAVIAAPWASLGIGAVSGFNLTALGLGLLVLAALYATLAARVFRRNGFRDYATVLWSLGLLLLIGSESALVHDSVWRAATIALTGAAIALLARPLRETRLWLAGIGVVAVTTLITVLAITPPDHFFRASQSPASGLVALVGCVAAFGAVAWSAQADRQLVLAAVTGGLGLYALSLGILDVAEHVSTASVATDFQRGHTAVSALWALVGLGLLIVGLMRGSTSLRYGGLVLFGLSLAKIFLYDLSELSSVARAFSFILVGGLLLAGGFFLQRLSDRLGPRHP